MTEPNNQATEHNPVGRFMVAVGAVLEHARSGKILIIKRAASADWRPNHWEIGYGRIDQFETPEAGLKRETHEELRITDLQIHQILTVWHFFRGSEKAENELIGITYYCTTHTEDIILSDEHSAFEWVSPKEAVKKVTEPGIIRDIEAYQALKQTATV